MVWADGEAVQLEVVTWVRNNREISCGECRAQAVGKLRAANATCEKCDAWAHAVRAGSTSRPKAAAHSA